MSIQSFTEKLLSTMDAVFENEANKLLNEARQRTGNESYIAGRMDGISESVKKVREVYSLFIKTEQENNEDESKPLY